jgi:uncharacterized protein YeeX (DUF496 family)
MSWGKRKPRSIIKYINDLLLTKLLKEIDDIKKKIEDNQKKIDISECLGILKELRILEDKVLASIDEVTTASEEASDDDKSEFEEELDKRKI